ncbi:sperm acrosome membrane-associated protein 4-like [Spea bombifrons]|uniref:sperm acrosome membrane-associated protein 4-like n=1 Tax=Spea bombifrons TaxID=233779 RepID=UPI00234AD6F0|nr:sperm acrosome membrane-associated protein 4-like [Spea bombifrons]
MKMLLTACFIVLLSCQIGQALDCYKCEYGTCLTPTKMTCGTLETCVTYTAQTGGLSLKKKGCTSPTNCMTGTSETYMGITVTTSPSCCITNLCNSAFTPRVSAVTGLAVLLSLWMAKVF